MRHWMAVPILQLQPVFQAISERLAGLQRPMEEWMGLVDSSDRVPVMMRQQGRVQAQTRRLKQ